MKVTNLSLHGDRHNIHVHRWFNPNEGGYYFSITGEHHYKSGRYDEWHDALAEAIDMVENEFEV